MERVILQVVIMLISLIRTHFRLKNMEREELAEAQKSISNINRRLEDDIMDANDRIIKEQE